jgi:hypothetical protein
MAVHLKGERVDEASTLERAAELLGRARLPVIGGLASTPPIKRRVENCYDRYYGIDPASFGVHGYIAARPDRFQTVPCLN